MINEIFEAQQKLIEEFSFFDNWIDRYQYIIDLGKRLPEFSETDMIDENKIKGCQSQVWIVASKDNDRIRFRAISDSVIVSGLVALLLQIYSNRRPQDILETPADIMTALDLEQHISPTRSNGLSLMLQAIYRFAGEAI